MRNILLSAFSIPILRAVCCNLNLNFIFYYGSYYLLLPLCSVQNGDMEWILIFGFFLLFCFIFGYDIIWIYVSFVMVAHGHWTNLALSFLLYFLGVSVQLYWENHCLCFLADVCIILFTHPFCPFIEKQLIKKMKV